MILHDASVIISIRQLNSEGATAHESLRTTGLYYFDLSNVSTTFPAAFFRVNARLGHKNTKLWKRITWGNVTI